MNGDMDEGGAAVIPEVDAEDADADADADAGDIAVIPEVDAEDADADAGDIAVDRYSSG